MSIWDNMRALTKPKINENETNIETSKASPGDIIKGIITNVVFPDENRKGGFGFIASQESLPFERIFFHWSGLRQDSLRFPELRKGMNVEFELKYSEPSEEHEGGYRAVRIKVLEK